MTCLLPCLLAQSKADLHRAICVIPRQVGQASHATDLATWTNDTHFAPDHVGSLPLLCTSRKPVSESWLYVDQHRETLQVSLSRVAVSAVSRHAQLPKRMCTLLSVSASDMLMRRARELCQTQP